MATHIVYSTCAARERAQLVALEADPDREEHLIWFLSISQPDRGRVF